MQNKKTSFIIVLLVVLALVFGGWYYMNKRGGVGGNARAELALLGYDSMSDLDALAKNFPGGERYVQSIKDALAMLDKEGVTEEERIEAHLTIGTSLNTLKNTDGAAKEYEKILAINPKHSVSLNNLAHLYQEKQDYAKAEEYYKKLIEASPTWFQAYTDLADMYRAYVPDKKSEIPGIIEGAIKESPNRTSLMMYLAEYYEGEGDKKNAAVQYQNILKIDANHADAKDGLARVGK